MKILFLVKLRDGYGGSYAGSGFSSGLANSARFAADLLNAEGDDARVVEVTDANDIDREVTAFRPKVVILEALWVTPEKLRELRPLHRGVRWIVRYHSELPFLAYESIALSWLKEYVQLPNVFVAANTIRTQRAFEEVCASARLEAGRVLLLPTYYPPPNPHSKHHIGGKAFNIACPGALRPFKNHLNQALGAILFCESVGAICNFHINADRVEQGGQPVLQNLQALFAETRHNLIFEPWVEHSAFLQFLHRMDVGMQVSLTETFNICAADVVSAGLPLVASAEIPWCSRFARADPNSPMDISRALHRVVKYAPHLLPENVKGLRLAASVARKAWLQALESI